MSLGDDADHVLVNFWGAPYIITESGDPIFREPFAVRVRMPQQVEGETASVIATAVISDSVGKGGEVVLWI